MRKTLSELAQDYYSAAEIVGERIRERNEKLRLLSPASAAAGKIKAELRVLYRERADARAIADHLASYYSA